jgi:hypothetical protein
VALSGQLYATVEQRLIVTARATQKLPARGWDKYGPDPLELADVLPVIDTKGAKVAVATGPLAPIFSKLVPVSAANSLRLV